MPLQHDFNREAGARLLNLALALYRNRLVEMPDAGHTDDILLLLRLANGDSELMAWASSTTGADADELRKSCVAFVERICFSGDTNPFNVLGLNPWANADAVREHYRLLIRIFHPDRGQVSNKTAEDYSARINQAYASLKNKIGDEEAKLSASVSASYHRQSGIIPRRFTRPVAARNNGADSMRWAARLTPAKVLFGFALLAWLIIYLSFSHKMHLPSKAVHVVEKSSPVSPDIDLTPAAALIIPEIKAFPEVAGRQDVTESTLAEQTKPLVAPVPPLPPVSEVKPTATEDAPLLTKGLVKVAPAVAVNDKKVAAIAVKPDTKAQTAKTVTVQIPATKQPEKPIEAKPAVTKPNDSKTAAIKTVEIKPAEVKPGAVKLAEVKPIEVKPVAVKTVTVKPASDAVIVQAVAPVAPVNSIQSTAELPVNNKSPAITTENVVAKVNEVPVQPKVVTSTIANIPTDRELHEVINRFMSHYATGDINGFMQTFDDQVRSDEGNGKADLHHAYADFFAKTASRSMVLKDLNWEKHGPLAIAHAAYRVSIQREGETKITSSSGRLQIIQPRKICIGIQTNSQQMIDISTALLMTDFVVTCQI